MKKQRKQRTERKPDNVGYDGGLFSFIRIFFTDPVEYNKLTQYEKGKHRFMLQRFMSIQYPIRANLLNINKTHAAHIVDCWRVVSSKYTRTPGWIWTKIDKTEKINNIKFEPDDRALAFYLNKYQISMRDYKEALKFNSDLVIKEIQSIEKQFKANG
jgi:hypothetical protein